MPLIYNEQVNDYSVILYEAGSGGDLEASIHLIMVDGKVGVLKFFRDREDLEPARSYFVVNRQYYSCSFHISQYPHAIDLLRNESPVWFRVFEGSLANSTGPIRGSITAKNEPVGEEET